MHFGVQARLSSRGVPPADKNDDAHAHMEKKITIIVPAYDSQDTIKNCLDSIFNVEYSNFEVILVDDCSSDKTVEIAKGYPCKIINSSERRGPGFSRDRGVGFADGEIVAFLDSDCIAPKDWLIKINEKIDSGIAGLGGKYVLPEKISVFSKILLTYLDPKHFLYKKSREVISFSGGNCAFWKSSLMRRTEKKELVYCNKIIGAEDTIMCCELHKFGKLIYDPDLRVLHDKAGSPIKILKTAVRYGYSGAIASSICGNLLLKEPDRVYKLAVYIFSITVLFSLLLFPFAPVRLLYPWLFILYLSIQLPIIVSVCKQLSIRLSLIFMPLGVFLIDIFHFIGHAKRAFTVIGDAIQTAIWHIKLLFNIISNKAVSRIFFFATRECNADCYFCFNKKDKQVYQENADLSLEEIRKVTETVGFLPWLTITGGEPFLRGDLYEICKCFYCNCDTRIISIVTNGILWQKIGDVCEKLLIDCRHLKLSVIVALDEIGERHDSIKGVRDCYKFALHSLEKLNTLKLRFRRLTLSINTMLLQENINRIDAIMEYFINNFNYDRQGLNLHRQSAKSGSRPDLISIVRYFDLFQEVNERLMRKRPSLKQNFNNALLEYCREKSFMEFQRKKPYRTCLAAQKFLVISNGGDVYPCELLLEKMGSLKKEKYDFKKIIKGRTAKSIRGKINNINCYCQWPCAIVSNVLFDRNSYGVLFKRVLLSNFLGV